MLGFVQKFFAHSANPIGVDFGSDSLRLAQVQVVDGDHRLVAAAATDVPSHVRNDPNARLGFFVEAVRDLVAQGNFRGRNTILSLPASWMHLQHLRVPKTDEATLKKSLIWEARGKIPIDPSQCVIRHIVAGEINVDNEPRLEVILMAAARERVEALLNAAAKAKLNVVGMNVEPKSLVDCFSHVYRRKQDQDLTNCFIDIGCAATRITITRGGQVYFARAIPIAGDHFNRAVAAALKIPFEDAKLLRIGHALQQPELSERAERQELSTPQPAPPSSGSPDHSFALLDAVMPKDERRKENDPSLPESAVADHEKSSVPASQSRAIEQACREPLARLVEEIEFCRRYYEATFPNRPVDRLIFVGGEARQRSLCQFIARELGLAAQVGDPICRMGRHCDIGIESGLDRRQPQPNWAVAIGLSMGPGNATSGNGETREEAA